MTTELFTDDGTATATLDRPDTATVKELERYGFKAESVRKWSPEKAETQLGHCRAEERIALRQAEDRARQQEEHVPRGQPTLMERQSAASCIEQAQDKGIEELSQCMAYSLYALSDDETKRLAGYLIRLMRGQGYRSESHDEEIPE